MSKLLIPLGLLMALAGGLIAAPAVYGAFMEYYGTVQSLEEDPDATTDADLESIGTRMRSHLPRGVAGAGVSVAGFIVFTAGWRVRRRSRV